MRFLSPIDLKNLLIFFENALYNYQGFNNVYTFWKDWRMALEKNYNNKTYYYHKIDNKQIFTWDVTYGNVNVQYIYQISVLKKLAHKYFQVKNIEMKEFTIPFSQIQYTETEFIGDLGKSDEPIIIIPFATDSHKKYLVVDGNHRVTAKISQREKFIKAYILNQEAASYSLFTNFQRTLYLFLSEVAYIELHLSHLNSFTFDSVYTNYCLNFK